MSLVTPDLADRKGVWSEPRSSYPIAASDIRRWAIATYWPEPPPPIFWDEAYARSTRWGGVIAPRDFNPFAWPVARPPMTGARGQRAAAGGRRLRTMNGGQTDTYGVPMRPGDVVSARSRLQRWEERTTRLGDTLFVFTENEWSNQDGQVVRRRLSTAIRY